MAGLEARRGKASVPGRPIVNEGIQARIPREVTGQELNAVAGVPTKLFPAEMLIPSAVLFISFDNCILEFHVTNS
jgi:hypothetical protein